MDNKHMEDYISPYLDGMLTNEENRIFEEHLAQCPKCQKELAEFKKFMELTKGLEEEDLPSDFHQKLHQRLLKEQESTAPGKNKNVTLLKWISGLAAAVVLLLSMKVFDRIDIYKQNRIQNSTDGARIEKARGNSLPEEQREEAGAEPSDEESNMQMAALDISEEESEEPKEKTGEAERKEPPVSTSEPDRGQENLAISMNSAALEMEEAVEQPAAEIQKIEEPMAGEPSDTSGEIDIPLEEEGQSDPGVGPVDDGKTRLMTALTMESIGTIYSDHVNIVVRDLAVTVEALKDIAEKAELEVVEALDDGIIVKVGGPEHRELLYRELQGLGELQDVGSNMESSEIRIVLVREE